MLFSNGFLVTDTPETYNNIQYAGIENKSWPLKYEFLYNIFSQNQMNQFEYFIDDLNTNEYSIGLVDFQLSQAYKQACDLCHQNYRVLYVEIIRDLPLNIIWHNQFAVTTSFLGFDVGICAYDYYSSLLSDVICRPELFDKKISLLLNENGLFNSIDDACLYLQERENLKNNYPEMTFESGVMDIISLYQIS